MVERRPDPIDRRVRHVFLTRDGRKLVAQKKELDKRVNETTLNGVPEADIEITMRTLDRMKLNLLAILDTAEGDGKKPLLVTSNIRG